MTRAAIHIVDDDPDIRDGLAWLFDSRGYRATTWASGPEFLQHARQQTQDWATPWCCSTSAWSPCRA